LFDTLVSKAVAIEEVRSLVHLNEVRQGLSSLLFLIRTILECIKKHLDLASYHLFGTSDVYQRKQKFALVQIKVKRRRQLDVERLYDLELDCLFSNDHHPGAIDEVEDHTGFNGKLSNLFFGSLLHCVVKEKACTKQASSQPVCLSELKSQSSRLSDLTSEPIPYFKSNSHQDQVPFELHFTLHIVIVSRFHDFLYFAHDHPVLYGFISFHDFDKVVDMLDFVLSVGILSIYPLSKELLACFLYFRLPN
jgi:hypothetical protein